MFVDRVKINVKGGNGGNGAVSFYRAKYVVNGGPDGGDGGKGGDIVFIADSGINNLVDFRYKRKFKAQNGVDGGKRNCTGADGKDEIIKVPVGTVIREASSGKVMADMAFDGQKRVIVKGGKGGKGNQHFATPTRQAPRYSERGRISAEYELILELKIIADAGLIGFPNVGKSTILKMVTNASPKIADYHFTTLSPNLGVVKMYKSDSFVIADIPGLIEGASEGAGLGHEFLRHIERTKVLIHVVDAAGIEGTDPVECIKKINDELRRYNEKLLERPMIIAANKTDIEGAMDNVERIMEEYHPLGIKVYPISAASNRGLDKLLKAVYKLVKENPDDIVFTEDYNEDFVVNEDIDTEPFTIYEPEKGYFVVEGTGVEKMVGYTNIDTEKGFAFFQKYLREKGIITALEEKGINEGDTVKIYDLEFDYYK